MSPGSVDVYFFDTVWNYVYVTLDVALLLFRISEKDHIMVSVLDIIGSSLIYQLLRPFHVFL